MAQDDLRKLVEEHYDRLFRAARFMCGDDHACEDLIQETFLAATQARSRFEGRSSDYTWLYGILLNKFRRWLRRKKRPVLSLQRLLGGADEEPEPQQFAADEPGPVDNVLRDEKIKQVRRAMDGLSADHRAVVTLRYVEGLSYQEIAEALGCPLGTVKSRIHYALERVAERLQSPAGGQERG